jgi:transcription initiation factor TFIIIB Brf1 subunit/transcription initiation factor TFIIB
MKCPECGEKSVEITNEHGKEMVICRSCGLVINDEMLVSGRRKIV